jgi:FMN reductase
MRLVTIYGSPTPPGKLAAGLAMLEDDVRLRHHGWDVERLAPTGSAGPLTGTWDPGAVETVTAADAVVIASPVYRGSITGTLKLLIDQLPNEALRSKPVGILTVAAAPHHFLSAERHLRDILSWFGALTAANSAFFVDQRLVEPKNDDEVVTDLQQFVDQVITLAEKLDGTTFGPDPLTVKYAARR